MKRLLAPYTGALLALFSALAAAEDLAPGQGSELVAKACTSCHALDNVTAVRKARDDWDNTIHLMVNYGLVISDDDMKTVLNYLNTYYGLQPRPKK